MNKRDTNRLFSQNTIKRVVIYGIITLVLASAQCAFFPLLNICPRTPDLIMGMLLAITLLDGEKSAAVCAVASGFFIDALGSSFLALSPVIYLVFVAFISVFTKKVLKSLASYLLLLMPMLVYRAAATYLCILITEGGLPAPWVFTQILLPEAIATGLLCIPVYFILKLCSGALVTHSRFTF